MGRRAFPPGRRAAIRRGSRCPGTRLIPAIAALLLLWLAAPQWLAGPARAEAVPYEVQIVGIEDAALQTTLERVSQLVGLRDRPPGSMAALERRAEADRARLDQALRANGYYDAEIIARVAPPTVPDRPAEVVVEVVPGPLYRLASPELRVPPGAPPLPGAPLTAAELGLADGAPARSADIVAAEGRLLQILAERAHPFARIADRRLVVDHSTRQMEVSLTVDPGDPAALGRVSFVGLRDMREAAVFGYVPWRHGDPYDPALIDELRRDLAAAGPFSSVAIATADAPDPDGTVPVTVTVEEAPGNFIGGGVSYATEDGPGIKLFWGDRNVFGHGERLEVTGRVSLAFQGLTTTFRRPHFLARSQSLLLSGEVARQDTDAYESLGLQLGATVERQLTPQLAASIGLDLSQTRITEAGRTRDTTLVGLPLTLTRDTTDALLDPTRGGRTRLQVTPYAGTPGAFGIIRGAPERLSVADRFRGPGGLGRGRHDPRRRHRRHPGTAAILRGRRRIHPRLRVPEGGSPGCREPTHRRQIADRVRRRGPLADHGELRHRAVPGGRHRVPFDGPRSERTAVRRRRPRAAVLLAHRPGAPGCGGTAAPPQGDR